VDASKNELLGYVRPAGTIQPLSTNLSHVHYTFYFAQSLILPHHARQIGQLCFTTPRKIHLFGVRLYGLSEQMNYMIDERIQQYQHFRFSANNPGFVFVKKRANSEENKMLLLKNNAPAFFPLELPQQMHPNGLTEERRRYLYRFVRHLVRLAAQDLSCPAPEE
jgi:hypothetical protein